MKTITQLSFMNNLGVCQGYFAALNTETQEHSLRVGEMCEEIGGELGFNKSVLYAIGVFHDIGKISIPEKIINKDSKLTDYERMIINVHSTVGGNILKDNFPHSYQLFFPVMFHHGFVADKRLFTEKNYKTLQESWNVTLTDNNLRALTSLVHLVDYFDARTTKRVYHNPVSPEIAVAEINKNSFLYDETIVDAIKHSRFFKAPGENKKAAYDNGLNTIKLIQCLTETERMN